MNDRNVQAETIGAASGLLFAGLTIAAMVVTNDSNPPSPEEPASTLARFMSDADQRSELGVSLALLGVFCLFWFLAYLRRVLQRAEGGDGWLSAVAYGGGLVFAGMLLVAGSIQVAGDVLTDYGSDAQAAKTLYLLEWEFIDVLAPPLAALVSATTAVILRQSAIPRWLGWLGVPFALLLVAPPLSWPAVPLAFIWVVIVSLALLVRSIRMPQSIAVPEVRPAT